jgi:hypothetical protein
MPISMLKHFQQFRTLEKWHKFIREQDHYKLEPNTCRTTTDFSLQFKQIQEESSESRYQ